MVDKKWYRLLFVLVLCNVVFSCFSLKRKVSSARKWYEIHRNPKMRRFGRRLRCSLRARFDRAQKFGREYKYGLSTFAGVSTIALIIYMSRFSRISGRYSDRKKSEDIGNEDQLEEEKKEINILFLDEYREVLKTYKECDVENPSKEEVVLGLVARFFGKGCLQFIYSESEVVKKHYSSLTEAPKKGRAALGQLTERSPDPLEVEFGEDLDRVAKHKN